MLKKEKEKRKKLIAGLFLKFWVAWDSSSVQIVHIWKSRRNLRRDSQNNVQEWRHWILINPPHPFSTTLPPLLSAYALHLIVDTTSLSVQAHFSQQWCTQWLRPTSRAPLARSLPPSSTLVTRSLTPPNTSPTPGAWSSSRSPGLPSLLLKLSVL